jgi:F5/8 type C domain/Alpha-L-fucosidase
MKKLKEIITHVKFNLFVLLLILFLVLVSVKVGSASLSKNKTDWFRASKWGVITHYLADANTSSSDWNARVKNFDVDGLARQLNTVGAKYYFITLGQNSGHYCSPNATYDRYTGERPSKCSSRDLVADLSKALKPYNIKLLVYLPSGAPSQDITAIEKLKWSNGPYRNQEFQSKWEAVIREWSLRWGPKVQGWWFDGAYWPKVMYDFADPPNFKTFAAAATAGNPKSILAFNSGVAYPIISTSKYEDYSAGEINEPWGVECSGRQTGKAQFHVMSYLGSQWGGGNPRYSNEKAIRITNNINKCRGVITWDVPIQENGHIPQPFVDQLAELDRGLKRSIRALDYKVTPPGNLASHKKTEMLDLSGKKPLPVNSAKYFSWLGVDGDYKTYALPSGEWAWTYQVDLGKIYPIKSIRVGFGIFFSTDYQILVSKDGSAWKNIAEESSANGGVHVYTFKPTNARYVRIKSLMPNGPNQKGVQMSISELEVYK